MQNPKLIAALIAGALLVVGAAAWPHASRAFRKDAAEPALPGGAAAAAQDDAASLMFPARTKGDSTAPIQIYEVSDFQCPYCRMFSMETLPALEREYIRTGKVRFTFLNFPIAQSHPNAPAAHELAMCAARQDRFWPVHDILYRTQGTWAALSEPGPYFRSLADSAGLDRKALEECFTSGSVRWLIQAEAEMSWRAGVTSTPSFIIEGGLLKGHAPIELWRPILDSLYGAKTAAGK